jgi:hypothetical protein
MDRLVSPRRMWMGIAVLAVVLAASGCDCAGGSGNGPNYVRGPIRVRPPDPFGLDRDGDGVGCEG